MTRITITGDHQTLLTHAALWGTAAILAEDLGASRVRAGWQDEDGAAALLNPRAVIEADGVSEIEIGRIIQGLALRVSASEHWAAQVAWRDAKEHTVSLLTPRTGLPKFKDLSGEAPGWWQQLEDRRASIMAELTPLEQEMVRGLGERSWWLSEPSGLRPDLGASPWEMKTRNRGEEFLKNRFLPLAAEVATWDPEKIIAGLTGESRDDAVGGNKAESRTATGFAPPGPCDNALAWCALWVMAMQPPLHRTQPSNPHGKGLVRPRPSSFAGRVTGAQGEDGKERLITVMPGQLISPMRWARLQRSAPLVRFPARKDVDPAVAETAQARLAEEGSAAVVLFEVSRSDNPSAPERRAETGVVEIL